VGDKDWLFRFELNLLMAKYNLEHCLFRPIFCRRPKYQTKLINFYPFRNIIIKGFWPSWNFHVCRQMKIFHIMRTFSLLSDMTLSGRAKCLYSVNLSFFHFHVWIIFYAGDCFSSVYLVRVYRMSIQISHNFNWVNFSVNLNFIGCHNLLYFFSNLS